MKGVSLGLKGTPYRMIVREPTRFFGEYVHADERQFLRDLIDNDQAAGAIVQRDPFATNGDVVDELIRRGTNLVFVDSPPPDGILADHVGTINSSAARLCVEHLIELGHRRIVCLIENDVSEVTRQRVMGYTRAMSQAGLDGFTCCLTATRLEEPPDSLHPAGRFARRLPQDSIFFQSARRLVANVLEMKDRPTALFVGCDVLATCVGALLEGAGLMVPDDISLTGFDWLARWENANDDDLTTASQDFQGFGVYAAELLLDRLDGSAPPSPRHVLLPAPLVIRSSTARRSFVPANPPTPTAQANVARETS